LLLAVAASTASLPKPAVPSGYGIPQLGTLESRLHKTAELGPPVADEYWYKVVDALDEVAEETGKTVPQVGVNWLLQRPSVSTVIIGARNEEQLRQNLGAVGWALSSEQVVKLVRCRQRCDAGLSLLAPVAAAYRAESPAVCCAGEGSWLIVFLYRADFVGAFCSRDRWLSAFGENGCWLNLSSSSRRPPRMISVFRSCSDFKCERIGSSESDAF
jgi:Aldo/keto reductase family